MRKLFTLMTLGLALGTTAEAQIHWNFDSAGPTFNSELNFVVDTLVCGNMGGTSIVRSTANPSTGYAGASGSYNVGVAAMPGGFDPSMSTFFEVKLTPALNFSVVLTGVSFGTRSAVNGPQAFAIRSSADGYASVLAAGALNNDENWAHTGVVPITLAGTAGIPIILRIYGFNGIGASGSAAVNWQIDDLTLTADPLPITLVSFRAVSSGDQVHLNWTTANESNAAQIIVQKSKDARTFTDLASLAAKNTEKNEYTYTDRLDQGTSYYRLKLMDRDGSFSYSNVEAVKDGARVAMVQAYPNPASDRLRLTYAAMPQPATAKVYAVDGRQVLHLELPANSTSSDVNLANLTDGSYLIVVDHAEGRSNLRFIKN